MPSRRKPIDASPRRSLLRRADQAVVATLVAASLAFMAAYWTYHGGHRGALIEIDRAAPLTAQFQVDVNTATWPELAQLPNIGESLAKRIVETREVGGPFVHHDGIRLRVAGIGPKTLDGIRPFLLPIAEDHQVAGQ